MELKTLTLNGVTYDSFPGTGGSKDVLIVTADDKVASHSSSEIQSAVEAGKTVFLSLDGCPMPLSTCDSNRALFVDALNGPDTGLVGEMSASVDNEKHITYEIKHIAVYSKAQIDSKLEGLVPEGSVTAKTVKMSNILNVGTIFEKPEGLPYCGWPFNDVQYDKDLNAIVFLINAAKKHGDNGNTHLYMGKLDLETYAVEIKEIGNPETLGHGFYTMGFCINNKGEYLYIDAQSQMLGKSTNKGETWTETSVSAYDNWPESITQLSNGRYLFWADGSKKGVLYSDDDCATWTRATMPSPKYEGHFLELTDGVVMCFMRKSTNGTDNGAWSGTKIQEPIVLSISYDYGATWTAATDSTTLLEGCANIATAFYHKDEDLVEVFTSPRYPYGDSMGAVWQYIATREDALNDRFGTPKVVLYSKALAYQDFGHIGGCMDDKGDMHLMYYDGDSDTQAGNVNYHYMKASRGQATLPTVNNDGMSLFLPYSGKKTGILVDELYKHITKVKNELLVLIGEIPDPGDSDNPIYWITDGMLALFDFSEDKFNAETYSFSPIGGDYADAKIYTTTQDGAYYNYALQSSTSTTTDALADLVQATIFDSPSGYTLELDVTGLKETGQTDYVVYTNNLYSWGSIKLYQFSTTEGNKNSELATSTFRDKELEGRNVTTISLVVDRQNKQSRMYANGNIVFDSSNYTVQEGYSVDFADAYNKSNRASWKQYNNKPYLNLGSWYNKSLRFYNRPLTEEEVKHNANYANL